MKNYLNNTLALVLISSTSILFGQKLGGQFGSQSVIYVEDSAANAVLPSSRFGSNTFLQLRYDYNNFSAGTRLESYSPALQGYDPRLDGFGVTNKFISYNSKEISITVGDIYEQFGEGLVLRSYWDWNLGFDNSIQGFSIKTNPKDYITVKGIVGKQRNYFSQSDGTIRGFDAQIDLLGLRKDSMPSKLYSLVLGANLVSKYQEDKNPLKKLPENVSAFSSRLNFNSSRFIFNSEFAFKINDPSFVNDEIYKAGNAQYINTSYSGKGLGINLGIKRVDNFDFRSDRGASGNDLFINYLPAITQNQTYTLFNLYPYFTQTMGEQGLDLNVDYKLPKKSKLGGKNGMNVHFNLSKVYALKTNPSNFYQGYNVDGLKLGHSLYQFAQLELSKKISSKLSLNVNYSYFEANNTVLRLTSTKGIITGHLAVIESNYKINSDHNLRIETQTLQSKRDRGSWVSLMLEYTYKRKVGLSVLDNYNYKTYENNVVLHYPSINVFYKNGALLTSAGYGRQNAGALCVGGICRFVPAYSGANLSISYNF